MIPWIFLVVIIIFAFFFFISRKETQNKKEVVLPKRRFPKEQEMEIAAEPGPYDLNVRKKEKNEREEKKPETEGTDLEVSSNISPEISVSRKIRVLDPTEPVDYCLTIEAKPKRLPGHEIPLEMDLVPSLKALVKDPDWVYVYWILPSEIPGGNLEIRVNNLSQGSHFFQRIEKKAGSWFFHLQEPDQDFSFELGVWGTDGIFRSLLISNTIHTPPNRPSDLIELPLANPFYDKITTAEGSPGFILNKAGGSEQLLKK